MTGEEIVALSRKHTIYEWSAQSKVDPIPVARAKGIYFWTPEGKRYIDFNSQLMCVNIGHGDERVIRAIQEQAATLAYANPFMATEPRARLGAKLAEITPGDIDAFFFTNGGAEANENAIKIARWYTGRHKILAFYRSYHGGTAGSITLTGDPRRWAAEPGIPGVVHVLNPYHGIQRGWDTRRRRARLPRRDHPARRAADDRRLHPRAGRRHQRHPRAARRLHPGRPRALRQVRHRHDRRRGDGRLRPHRQVVLDRSLERRARHHHDGEGADGAYVQLGAVGVRRKIADHFTRQRVLRRAHLQQPSARLRVRARDDCRLRGGRADRAGGRARRADEGAARRSRRRAIRRSAPCARSACSASSS